MFKTKTFIFTILFLAIAIYTISEEPAAPVIDSKKLEGAREFYNLGLSAFSNKQYEKAKDFFLEAISYYEDFAEAYAKLGDTYIMLKDEENGYENYKKCIEIIDKTNVPDNEMANLSKELKRKTEKFRALEEKISILDKDFIAKLMSLGGQCLNDNDYLMAEELFSLVLRLEENNGEASDCLQKAKDNLKEETTEEPITEDNKLANAYYQSGLALIKQNKYDEAIEKFNKAISCRRNFPQALFKLGECCEKQGNKSEAIPNYRLCLKYLQKKDNFSKEESELYSVAYKTLEKIDTNGRQMSKIKADYVASLLSLANECFNKKYQRFTYRAVQKIIDMEPTNKNAQSLLSKIDKNVLLSMKTKAIISDGPVREIFNGKDIKNWKRGGDYNVLDCWVVQKGKIVANPLAADAFAILLWNEPPPENYILTIKFNLDEIRGYASEAKVGMAFGTAPGEKDLYQFSLVSGALATLGEHEFKVTKRADKTMSSLNGKDSPEELCPPLGEVKIGLVARNARVSFIRVAIQELNIMEKPEREGAKDTKAVQNLFNGKDINNWTVANSDDSVRDCWTVRQRKIDVNTKYPGTRTVLLWKDTPPTSYKLTLVISIEGPIAKDKDSRTGIIYGSLYQPGQTDLAFDVSSIYFGEGSPKSQKLEIIRKDNLYTIIRDGKLFKNFEQETKPPAIGIFAQNIRMTISSITLEEVKE